ncbi:biotin--[acetyl-CoA-carboxylase] ligase [Candidatus Profftella armatura (Diaphorina cf. continua)]|uniref:Biotin--[acetyl-CoA-carboxylase] ligase n=1 Tax=Candidatus Profftella armatura (Diaphorina cf. continua) TaxID=2661583 RepID=A0A7R6VZ80_9PROT|nr:biotin--[acetyl-CoA-carboxylase] ligase [Candidatus Profftella armatura (Diaphorina cf. continua)]BCG49776.1 biotin--[acetyl-CoA-carboxylase] ligase [Candidatus Profftella armatura (Diaphorina cf. continua)]
MNISMHFLNTSRIKYLYSNYNTDTEIDIRTIISTNSTNLNLLSIAKTGLLFHPTFLATQIQTSGRGRAGRIWYSEPEITLTFSLAWKFKLSLQYLTSLPLVISLALSIALKEFGQKVQLKWPNDLLLNGNKFCGILIDTFIDKKNNNSIWAIIGVGLNLGLPRILNNKINIGNISELLKIEREKLLAVFICYLIDALKLFEHYGFSIFIKYWNFNHAYTNQVVNILNLNKPQKGIVIGVEKNGCLLLDTKLGKIIISSGNVSLRLRK